MIIFLFILMSIVALTPLLEARRIYSKTISEFVQEYPQTKWTLCTQNYGFDRAVFPLYQEYSQSCFPSKGYHTDISVIEVPNGVGEIVIIGDLGDHQHIFVNDVFVQETMIKNYGPFGGNQYIERDALKSVQKVTGRVAILNHLCPHIYGHWIFDILGQLALLEIYNIQYDYLWIPYDAKFMKETLEIWGIDSAKIIPMSLDCAIAADTVIVPMSVGQNDVLIHYHVNYYPDFVLKYVSDKLLSDIKKLDQIKNFSKKIFISRKNGYRSVSNEDEVFALFEPFGFERYELTSLSIEEQITLFNNATTVISFVGSGSTNIIFCRPETHYIEILQSVVDATFFFISDTFKLKYSCINATTYNDLFWGHPCGAGRELPLNVVQNFIKDHYFEL